MNIYKSVMIPVFLLLCGGSLLTGQSISRQPDIIVFIADDAGMDFGCYGNASIKTPNIDRLAEKGLRCSKAFLTTSQCSPTRTSILSGQFAHTIGTEDLHQPLDEHTRLIPHYLRQEGYYTGMLMKRHLGPNGDAQFDHIGKGRDSQAPELFKNLLDEAGDRPVFAWVAFTDPHRPYGGKWGAPEVHDPREVVVPPYFVDAKATRGDLARYYDEIHRMDRSIGAMLQELKKRGRYEHTLIIFLSDNGMPFPRCKATAYDHGIQTPLIFHCPGKVVPGEVYDGLLSVIDLAPTILDIAGIAKPPQMYGNSIARIFQNPGLPGREWIFAERNWHDTDEHIRCIRTEKYKLIVNGYPELLFPITGDYPNAETWWDLLEMKRKGSLDAYQAAVFSYPRYQVELYDIQADPYEIDNLIQYRKYQEIATELNEKLLDWQEETGDYPSFRKRRSDILDRKSGFFFHRRYYRDYEKHGYWDE